MITTHWKELIAKGARVRRFDASYEAAWDIVDTIITNAIGQPMLNQTVLQIQKELADSGTSTLDTRAGKYAIEDSPSRKFSFRKAIRPFVGLFNKRKPLIVVN